ncbi:MAG: PpiC-type peptidyl-prolyl cis-trans isomerase [Treponematales bacterium]
MASREKKPPVQGDSAYQELVHRFKSHPFLFTGTVVTLVIVIVAFVLVPAIPGVGGPAADMVFGYYHGVPLRPVSGNYFARVLASLEQQQAQINEGNRQMMTYQIWRDAFDSAVVHAGILDEMREAGYEPPPEEVDREVAILLGYHENEKLAEKKRQQMSNAEQLKLWRDTREVMMSELYLSKDFTENFRASSKEKAFVTAMAGPVRTFSLALFPLSAYPDSEVSAYAGEHAELFQVVHHSVITLTASEKEAKQVWESVRNGTAVFEEAAGASSKDSYADRGGDMGVRMAWELETEVPDAAERREVLALAKGELSRVVKVPAGWAFFRAEEDARPADMGEAGNVEKARAYLTEFERGRVEDWLIRQADGLIARAKAAGFDAACADYEVSRKSFGPLPLNYGGAPLFTSLAASGVSELAEASTNEYFWRACFAGPVGSPAAPVVLGDNVAVVFPREESPAEENTVSNIEAYYSYWTENLTQQDIRSYFLDNPKLEDKFMEAFLKYLMPSLSGNE